MTRWINTLDRLFGPRAQHLAVHGVNGAFGPPPARSFASPWCVCAHGTFFSFR